MKIKKIGCIASSILSRHLKVKIQIFLFEVITIFFNLLTIQTQSINPNINKNIIPIEGYLRKLQNHFIPS